MFKEKGYQQFLDESIKRGNQDLEQGHIISREQALLEIRQAIFETEKELSKEQLAFDGLVYG